MESTTHPSLHKKQASDVEPVGDAAPTAGPTSDGSSTGIASPERSGLRRFLTAISLIAAGLWMTGTVLRLTIRDQVLPSAVVFYALPVPVLVFLGLLFCWHLRRRRKTAWRFVGAILLLQTLTFFASTVRPPMSVQPAVDGIRMVFWNVCRGYGGYEDIAVVIREMQPDVAVLVEATHAGQEVGFWRQQLPNHHCERLGSGMLLLIRGQCHGWSHGHVAGVARYRLLDLEVNSRRFSLAIVDVASHPLVSRRPAFEWMKRLAAERNSEPLIVAGDFNTPPDSVFVDKLREDLTNSYEAAGTGYRETWPVILPVLGLDQVWGNSGIKWQTCRHEWSLQSDHRPVIVDFATR